MVTIATDTWKGVSSDGVTSAYQAEAAEVADNTPVLAQPVVSTEMGRSFIPFSIELGQDWPTLQSELTRLFSDARDTLDATKMLSGSGTNEPAGVLTGLTTSQRVLTNAVATFAVGDPLLLKQGLPARYVGGASVVANPAVFDTIYRFTGGNATEPPIMPTRDGACFGKPAFELSTCVSTTTTGSKIMLFGDFSTT